MNRDKINALAGMSRFPISLAQNLAEEAIQICETRAEARDAMLSLLLSESLARALIQHGNWRAAEKRLRSGLDRLFRTPYIGPLQQFRFLRTCAPLYRQRGDRQNEWEYFIGEAMRLGTQAGLQHQLEEIRLEYKGAVGEIDEAVGGGSEPAGKRKGGL